MYGRMLATARCLKRSERSRWGTLRPADWAVIQFLDVLNNEMQQAASDGQRIELLSLRDDFRKILCKRPRVGISHWIMTRGESQRAAPVAVWLLGRCSRSIDTRLVGRMVGAGYSISFAHHLAKSLRRVSAWQGLEQLAARFPNKPAVQRIAKLSQRASFEDRLSHFSRHVNHSRAAEVPERSQMSLWFSGEFWRGRQARSAQAIRAVLERIHRLVHRV